VPSSAAQIAYALEDALVNLLTAETQPGGKLAGIVLIEKAAPPEQKLFPCIGVAFTRFDEQPLGIGRDDAAAMFDLVLVVEGKFAQGRNDMMARARAALRPFVDDGASNGLIPLLMSQPTLSGICRRSKIISAEEILLESKAQQAGTLVAYAVTFQAQFSVQL